MAERLQPQAPRTGEEHLDLRWLDAYLYKSFHPTQM